MGKKIKDALWGTTTRKVWTIVVAVLFVASLIIPFTYPVSPPHVALSGEQIFADGPAWLTNTVLTTIIVDIIILLLALITRFTLRMVPGGVANFMEMVVEGLYGLSESVAGKNATKFFTWSMTIFLFVIVANWSGLIPGVGSIGFYQPVEPVEELEEVIDEEHGQAPVDAGAVAGNGFRWDAQLAMAGGNLILAAPESIQAAPVAAEEGAHEKFVPLFRAPSADLNVTFALALSTMFMVQVWGVRFLGGSYFRKFFTFSGPNLFMKFINAFVGILELISEVARILAFGFRLYGNIFAGEIVLATMTFLFAFLLPVAFYGLEVFVGFVQALVFMMLSLVFFQMATIGHSGDHDEHH
ncbi:MAG: F0F1 ATP synthase subunit A [Anaerolineales bacterium]|nr:F0F1 ATP synthase subunit A [Anaerolineales bacterium]